jgi:hypothetical protein
MKVLFFVLAVVAALYGISYSLIATSAVQEAAAGIGFIVSAIFLVGAGVVEAIHQARVLIVSAIGDKR